MPPEKKAQKEKVVSKAKKSSQSSSTDSKIANLDSKWSERFNRLEALLLSKTFQPTFSSEVKLTPSHSPPTNISIFSTYRAHWHGLLCRYASGSQPARVGLSVYHYRTHRQGFLCYQASTSQPAHIRQTGSVFSVNKAHWQGFLCFTASTSQPTCHRPADLEITSEAHWHRFV